MLFGCPKRHNQEYSGRERVMLLVSSANNVSGIKAGGLCRNSPAILHGFIWRVSSLRMMLIDETKWHL